MCDLSSSDGTFKVNSRSNHPALRNVSSKFSGLLVAPITITGFSHSSRSSIHETNYVTILFSMSLNYALFLPAIESMSSMNNTAGASSITSLKIPLMLDSLSPESDDTISGPLSLKNGMSLSSPHRALTNIDLPLPVVPHRSTPHGGLAPKWLNS